MDQCSYVLHYLQIVLDSQTATPDHEVKRDVLDAAPDVEVPVEIEGSLTTEAFQQITNLAADTNTAVLTEDPLPLALLLAVLGLATLTCCDQLLLA